MKQYKYEETMLKRVIDFPKQVWNKTSLYTFILAIPMVLLLTTLGVVLSIVLDTIVTVVRISTDD